MRHENVQLIPPAAGPRFSIGGHPAPFAPDHELPYLIAGLLRRLSSCRGGLLDNRQRNG